ncbi:MAG: YciI family protein [Thermoleophilia bacterium]|jgi:hypothetical protein|nr:YciI family protein [Thermoleophilia bacterium]
MKYMILIYSDPAAGPAEGSPEMQAEFGQWMALTQELAESGQMVGGDALHPVQAATTVRVRDGEAVLTDGPFAETKEHLGGYYIVDVPDLDAATAWAARMPNAHYGSIEVRPVMVF